jgi:uncharacterized membrane protein
VLCGVGLYTSLFMLGKGRRADKGLLDEPSVVQTARARLFGGVQNAALGLCYYGALAAGVWLMPPGWPAWLLVGASVVAAATSVYLAYSLLYVTHMPCVYCWTSHVLNWVLVVLLIFHAIHPAVVLLR